MRTIVIGLGRFGLPLAKTLAKRGWEVIGIDSSASAVDRAKDVLPFCARVDAMDEPSLREVIGKGVELGVVAIGDDFQSAVLAVTLLKDMGVQQIIARANSEREAHVLKMIGASRAVQIEAEMGERLGKGILSQGIVDFLPLQDEAALVEWKAPENYWGHTLREMDLRKLHGINVVAIWSSDLKRWDFSPDPEDRIHKGDVLMLIGPEDKVEKLTGA
ncbi:MAG: TrkA family potassium uptake protein [Nitrospirae bacterium]|nr:TrkA family potassium uptake protein [Nitrospirota bacterium]